MLDCVMFSSHALILYFLWSCEFTLASGSLSTLANDLLDTQQNTDSNIDDQNVFKYAQNWGFGVERHHVVTKDGYNLTLHRLMSDQIKSTKGPVILLAGIVSGSVVWISNKRSQSLGFLLSDAGHDVWLASTRGTEYSLQNIYMKPGTAAYWDFSYILFMFSLMCKVYLTTQKQSLLF